MEYKRRYMWTLGVWGPQLFMHNCNVVWGNGSRKYWLKNPKTQIQTHPLQSYCNPIRNPNYMLLRYAKLFIYYYAISPDVTGDLWIHCSAFTLNLDFCTSCMTLSLLAVQSGLTILARASITFQNQRSSGTQARFQSSSANWESW